MMVTMYKRSAVVCLQIVYPFAFQGLCLAVPSCLNSFNYCYQGFFFILKTISGVELPPLLFIVCIKLSGDFKYLKKSNSFLKLEVFLRVSMNSHYIK